MTFVNFAAFAAADVELHHLLGLYLSSHPKTRPPVLRARGLPGSTQVITGLVLDKERCHNGHFWVLVAPERHVLYRYSRHHDSGAADKLLADYAGYLVVDAHLVHDHLFKDGLVVEIGCRAHARRYWFRALPSDPERAKVALSLIGSLFRIERESAQLPRKRREQVRTSKSSPLVDRFFQFCDAEAERVLDKSPVAIAIRYARNQQGALRRFLDDGRLSLHNNISEINLRRQVLGRRNWLFCSSDDGTKANTVFVSLLASGRMHQIEPLAYLRDLLYLRPRWPALRLLDLAPLSWNKTLQEPDTPQRLAANPFRRAVLALDS